MKRIVLVVAAVVLVTAGAVAALSLRKEEGIRRELEALREELRVARVQADSCRVALTWEEQEFLGFDSFVDSLRTRVDDFEDPDQGGVPEADYAEYLRGFNRYNDSVAVWQERADSLRAREAECRSLAEAHNLLRGFSSTPPGEGMEIGAEEKNPSAPIPCPNGRISAAECS